MPSSSAAISMAAAAYAGAMLFLPLAANAGCSQWDISGKWDAKQNDGWRVSLQIQQDGNELRGSGESYATDPDQVLVYTHGSLDGSIEGNDFEFTVYWHNKTIGVYKGSINSRGRLEGSTYDRMNPTITSLWHSDETGGKCADAPPAQPAPTQAPAPKPKTADEKLLQGVKKIPKQFGTSPQ